MVKVLSSGVFALVACATLAAQQSETWSAGDARQYLDSRMSWWTTWPVSARDHQTFCVSCHTVLPYALARPALRRYLREQTASAVDDQLTQNVARRVRLWKEVEPFYPEARGVGKAAESRGTESILNALILAWRDDKSPDTRLALDNMWAQQLTAGEAAGAWEWLQFHNAPWEGDSQYFGATLAAIAAGTAGDAPVGLKLLREYLIRKQESQVLFNRVMLLWASVRLPGLLTTAQQRAIMNEAFQQQQPDGGFSFSSFMGDWRRRDGTPLETKSDGLATGLVTYVLQEAGVPQSQPHLERGLAWLERNQEKSDGRWLAYSLNKQRDLSSDVGRFMSDAATAYAVLSLEKANAYLAAHAMR